MRKKIIIGAVIGCLFIGALAYYFNVYKNDTNEVIIKDANVVLPEGEYTMTGNDLQDFDLAFLKLEDSENIVYSPLSIKYALSMLSEGASGTTKAQIDGVLGDYETKTYTNSENLSLANALFIKDTYKKKIKSSYIETVSSKYNAEVIYDSFKSASTINEWVSNKTLNIINDLLTDEDLQNLDYVLVNALGIDMEWVQAIQYSEYADNSPSSYIVDYSHESYYEKIKMIGRDESYDTDIFNNEESTVVNFGVSINNYDIISDLGEDNIRVTVKEAYEKFLAGGGCGKCDDSGEYPCTSEAWLEKNFATYLSELASNYQQVDISTDFSYYIDDNVKVFAKDLKEYDNTTLEYVAIMPINDSIESYVANVTVDDINNMISNLKTPSLENSKEGVITKIFGYVPLYEIEYELDLVNDLKSLGITNVFSSSADFSNLTKSKSAIINATHKANINFYNEGIKAAAILAAGGNGDIGCWFDYEFDVPVEEIDLTFDKPFMFLIRDKNTGEVWFAGVVSSALEAHVLDEYDCYSY